MNLHLELTEEELHYLQRLANVDSHRQIEATDHALSHGTRGFVAMESKVTRGVIAKMEAAIVSAAFDLGTETAERMLSPVKCDGDHAGPPCADPHCWHVEIDEQGLDPKQP